MKVFFVSYFLFAEVFCVLTDQNINSHILEVKQLGNVHHSIINLPSYNKFFSAERKIDPEYYSSQPKQFTGDNYHEIGRYGYRRKVATKLQNQKNRPFKHYGPPNQGTPHFLHEHNQQIFMNNDLNMVIPNSTKLSKASEENSIASQNNQPFGQYTANYLPPKNQELPSYSVSHLFLNRNHDFPNHYQQQRQQFHYQGQQKKQLHQFQNDNKNFLRENIDVSNPNSIHNVFLNQQISDAVLFLSKNAQAIANLYGIPASNDNYAPNNKNIEHIIQNQQQNQQNQQNLKTQIVNNDQFQEFPSLVPSYASGILSSQETLEKIRSLKKDRLNSQLHQALINQEMFVKHYQNVNSNNYSQSKSGTISNLEVTKTNPSFFNTRYNASLLKYQPFLPSNIKSSLEGIYGTSLPIMTSTPIPISPTSVTVLEMNQHDSEIDNTQVDTSLSETDNIRSSITDAEFSKYEEVVPTFISSSSSIPNFLNYRGQSIFTTPSKSVLNSPTYFSIPISTNTDVQSSQSGSTITTNLPSISSDASIYSIPLRSIHSFFNSVQPQIVNPNPHSAINGATQIDPTLRISLVTENPAIIYKPLKVYSLSYYPNAAYQQLQKPLGIARPTNVWKYAPSLTQVKPFTI